MFVCHYLFVICPSPGASGGLCFVIGALPGHLHIYVSLLHMAENVPSLYTRSPLYENNDENIRIQ